MYEHLQANKLIDNSFSWGLRLRTSLTVLPQPSFTPVIPNTSTQFDVKPIPLLLPVGNGRLGRRAAIVRGTVFHCCQLYDLHPSTTIGRLEISGEDACIQDSHTNWTSGERDRKSSRQMEVLTIATYEGCTVGMPLPQNHLHEFNQVSFKERQPSIFILPVYPCICLQGFTLLN
jgi:hypothetical protein